ncbi:MAG: hypothetical protein ACREMY_21160, partial [bacterium]
LGLTVSYAAPVFFNPAGSSGPVARDSGPTCASNRLFRFFREREWSSECESPGESPVLALADWRPTPFTIAYGMSFVQRILWLFVAANLPAIIRRRK